MAIFHYINLFLILCCRSLSHRSDVGGLLGTREMRHYTFNNKLAMFLEKQLIFPIKFGASFWLTMIWMYLYDLFVSLKICTQLAVY